MLALNVTIYGLGIVFLALLVLMVAIMLLTKVFSMATGKDLLEVQAPAAPEAAPPPTTAPTAPAVAAPPTTGAVEPVIAPLPGKVLSVAVKAGNQVRRGDELCVIEAMKMGNSVKAPRDGIVAEVCVAAGDTVSFGAPLILLASTGAAAAVPRTAPPAAAPAAPPPAPVGASSLMLTVSGVSHAVEVAMGATGAATVRLDGSSYQVQRDPSDGKKVVVNGKPHMVEVKEMVGTSATVLIDGVSQKIEVARRAPAAPLPLSLAHAGKPHTIEVRSGDGGASTVLVDGSTYQVEQDRTEPTRILVNGQAHTVEVKEMAGTSATVLIDGRTERLEIARDAIATASPAAPMAASAAPAPPHSGQPAAGERVTAPLPGKVLSVAVKAGDGVRKGDELCVIEAMKMGNSIRAQRDGTIREVLVAPGQTVAFGAALLVLD
jgi:glutaconyl-CoA/methylmalonyl-CoA decarboxylase subunit gamma